MPIVMFLKQLRAATSQCRMCFLVLFCPAFADDMAGYSISDFEDNDDFHDDEALLAKDEDSYDSDAHALDHLDMDDVDDSDLQRTLAALPPQSPDHQPPTSSQAQATPGSTLSSVSAAAASPPKPQQAWSKSQPDATQPKNAEETQAASSDREMVVLAVGGRIDIVSNDDIRAQAATDGGIGLAPEVDNAVESGLGSQSGDMASQNSSKQSSSGANGKTGSSSSGAFLRSSSTSCVAKGESKQTTSGGVNGRLLSKSSKSMRGVNPPGKHRPFSSPHPSLFAQAGTSNGDEAFKGWLAAKNRNRPRTVPPAQLRREKEEAEERRKQTAKEVFNGWLTAKREQKQKEQKQYMQLKEEREEEKRQKELRKELSEGSYEAWLSDKAEAKRRSIEEKQLLEELEQQRMVTITVEQNDAAYRE